jgi:hypothetical protein
VKIPARFLAFVVMSVLTLAVARVHAGQPRDTDSAHTWQTRGNNIEDANAAAAGATPLESAATELFEQFQASAPSFKRGDEQSREIDEAIERLIALGHLQRVELCESGALCAPHNLSLSDIKPASDYPNDGQLPLRRERHEARELDRSGKPEAPKRDVNTGVRDTWSIASFGVTDANAVFDQSRSTASLADRIPALSNNSLNGDRSEGRANIVVDLPVAAGANLSLSGNYFELVAPETDALTSLALTDGGIADDNRVANLGIQFNMLGGRLSYGGGLSRSTYQGTDTLFQYLKLGQANFGFGGADDDDDIAPISDTAFKHAINADLVRGENLGLSVFGQYSEVGPGYYIVPNLTSFAAKELAQLWIRRAQENVASMKHARSPAGQRVTGASMQGLGLVVPGHEREIGTSIQFGPTKATVWHKQGEVGYALSRRRNREVGGRIDIGLAEFSMSKTQRVTMASDGTLVR